MSIDNLLTTFEREIFLKIGGLRAAGIPPLLIDGVLSQVLASLRMDIILMMTGAENEMKDKIRQLEAEAERNGDEEKDGDEA